MEEAQTPHFYDLWIFEPITKPQNQLFLSLETQGHLKQIQKTPGRVLHIRFTNLNSMQNTLKIYEKMGTCWKRMIFGNMRIKKTNIFESARVVCCRCFGFIFCVSHFYIMFSEDEDRKMIKFPSIKSTKYWI